MSLSALRRSLADALADGVSLATVHSFPPAMINPPAIVVVPDDPYIEPLTVGSNIRAKAYFRITILAGIMDNEGSLEMLENLAAIVYNNIPKGYEIGSCSRPTNVQVGASDLLAAEIRVAITTEIQEG